MAVFVAALALSGSTAGPALADGDPASDVLATQTLFLPWDAGVSGVRQARLLALLDAARRAGIPVRVAIVASASDLGSVGVLWHQPRRYANYLGQELSLVYRGPLLVLMPDGCGVYHGGRRLTTVEAAIERSRPGIDATRMLATATAAVRRLAAASGRQLRPARVAVHERTQPRSPLIWLALAAGAALIVASWVASLRVRPLGMRTPRVR